MCDKSRIDGGAVSQDDLPQDDFALVERLRDANLSPLMLDNARYEAADAIERLSKADPNSATIQRLEREKTAFKDQRDNAMSALDTQAHAYKLNFKLITDELAALRTQQLAPHAGMTFDQWYRDVGYQMAKDHNITTVLERCWDDATGSQPRDEVRDFLIKYHQWLTEKAPFNQQPTHPGCWVDAFLATQEPRG